ncbi:MAG: cell surface protein SprA, partial [Gemmatimonadales bacterium]
MAVNCTRFNSFVDTEDLDGDNRLDILVGRTQEDLIRYVFPIGDPQYFVRSGGSIPDTEGRPMVWRLYRIPIRGDSVQVGSPTLRQVRAMRMTVVVPDNGRQERELFFSLARMKLIGAPWLKRSETPIAGIHGARAEPHGEVVASVVSTENRDLGYESPPGLGNQATRAGQSLTFSAEQINERSLRLLARDLRQGERAESFIRFADESDNSFLNYRLLRVWARGRGLGWQENDLEFFIKVGRDENNFYMYRQSVRTDQWEPEIVIDMRRWLELRAVIETRWLEGQAPSGSAQCGGSDSAFVICDGPYVVHVADPGVGPPNLARVSEVAVGMYRGAETVPIDLAELWVDDIRLDDVVNDVGYAGAFDARLSAADIGEVSLAFTNRDDQFRQLGENPSYVGDRSLRLAGMVRVDRLLPRSWGMNIPITFQRNTTSQNPFFLNRSDVLAEGLPELRAPRTEASLLQFALARERRGDSWIARNVLDPLRVTGRLQESEAVALLSEATNSNKQVRVQYNRRTEAKSIRAVPGFIVSIVDALPGFIRNSEFARALRRSRLRWNPVQFNLSSSITNNRSVRSAFRAPVASAADSLIPPTRSILHMWVNDANVDFRPFTTLSLAASLSSMRDLRDYGDSTTVSRLLQDRSKTLLGTGVGFERQQSFSTRLRVDPVLSTWFFPRIVLNTNYTFNRDPNNANPVREGT